MRRMLRLIKSISLRIDTKMYVNNKYNELYKWMAYLWASLPRIHLRLLHPPLGTNTFIQNHILFLSFLLLFIFFILFVLYALAVYSLFHKQPGYETYHPTQGSQQGFSIEKIGEYKENESRLNELVTLIKHNVTL